MARPYDYCDEISLLLSAQRRMPTARIQTKGSGPGTLAKIAPPTEPHQLSDGYSRISRGDVEVGGGVGLMVQLTSRQLVKVVITFFHHNASVRVTPEQSFVQT
jgi:hypothetical protein